MQVYRLITEELSDRHIQVLQKRRTHPHSQLSRYTWKRPPRDLCYLQSITLTNTVWSITSLCSLCHWDLFVKSSGRKWALDPPWKPAIFTPSHTQKDSHLSLFPQWIQHLAWISHSVYTDMGQARGQPRVTAWGCGHRNRRSAPGVNERQQAHSTSPSAPAASCCNITALQWGAPSAVGDSSRDRIPLGLKAQRRARP